MRPDTRTVVAFFTLLMGSILGIGHGLTQAQITARPLTVTPNPPVLAVGSGPVSAEPAFFYTFAQLPQPMQQALVGFQSRQLPKIGQGDPGGLWGQPDAVLYWSEDTPPGEPVQPWSIYYATQRFGAMIARANYSVSKSRIETYWYGAVFAHETITVTTP